MPKTSIVELSDRPLLRKPLMTLDAPLYRYSSYMQNSCERKCHSARAVLLFSGRWEMFTAVGEMGNFST